MSEEDMNRLQHKLEKKLGKWHIPSGTTMDDLVADSISALWLSLANGKHVADAERWLLVTARNKRLEHFCRVERERSISANFIKTDRVAIANGKFARFHFDNSQVWQSLSESQKFAVIQVVMHDRAVGDIAKELGLKRSTVKSWITRIPRRLAKDTYFQSLLGKKVSNEKQVTSRLLDDVSAR